ncbi:Ribosomal protein L34 [Giardia muris]|uniref:Ribosomal protein L34 n=1 Tax=Giardia muris TaxID=5742 RepID=A0A4Z1SM39_GIAMU|nr:Ribosomal protein L34 [Giardia muris]|eukprot:TNJ26744.1 Ribosomal protein L34 [Giardia muris]
MGKSRSVKCPFHSTYRTRSHRYRVVRTPKGKLTARRIWKIPHAPKCAETGKTIQGIPRVHPRRLTKSQRTVARPFGGKLCANALREKILEAFLSEENKLMQSVASKVANQ